MFPSPRLQQRQTSLCGLEVAARHGQADQSRGCLIGIHIGIRTEVSECVSASLLRAIRQPIQALVPKVGVEPTTPFGERILNPPRLPFRHFGSGGDVYQTRAPSARGQAPRVGRLFDGPGVETTREARS